MFSPKLAKSPGFSENLAMELRRLWLAVRLCHKGLPRRVSWSWQPMEADKFQEKTAPQKKGKNKS